MIKLDEVSKHRTRIRNKVDSSDVPNHWKVTNLGVINKYRPKTIRPLDFPDEIFEYYSIPAFQEQRGPKYVQGKQILSSKFLISNHTVLFGKLNPRILKVWLVDSTSKNRRIASTEFIPICTDEDVESEFIYYLCHSDFVVLKAKRLVSGSTPSRQRVDRKSFSQIHVPIPPRSEQQAIARILKSLQETKAARQREIELEHERKTALMQHLFTYGIQGEITKQTEIGEMPESWQVTKLVDVSDIRYGLGQPPEFDRCGIPMVRATDIKKGRIVSGTIKCVRQDSVPKSRDPYLKKGDLLVVRSGAYTGDAAMYDGVWRTAIAGYDLVVSPMMAKINPEFLAFYILGETAQSYFRSQRDRSAQPHLNSKQLGETHIPLPSLQEQIEVKNVLQALERRILLLETERDLFEELFNSMLEELMVGSLSTKLLIQAGA